MAMGARDEMRPRGVRPRATSSEPREGQTVTFWPEYDAGSPWRWSRYHEGFPTEADAIAVIEKLDAIPGPLGRPRPWRIAKVTATTTYLPYQRGRVKVVIEDAPPATQPGPRVLPAPEPMPRCHAGRDGECYWQGCPQLADGEPEASGRHCPLDTGDDEH